MPSKIYLKRRYEIKPIATGYGACFATDKITVEGCRIGYFYRESPESPIDSGWRFLSGDEPNEYIDNPNNIGVHDVNTIANYDPNIIAYLKKPVGSVFIRDPKTDAFVALEKLA
ncbi:MAG: DUF2185 domain-containing protein [Gloeobacterales cyanobacterium]